MDPGSMAVTVAEAIINMAEIMMPGLAAEQMQDPVTDADMRKPLQIKQAAVIKEVVTRAITRIIPGEADTDYEKDYSNAKRSRTEA